MVFSFFFLTNNRKTGPEAADGELGVEAGVGGAGRCL